jgi:hypothetical protein
MYIFIKYLIASEDGQLKPKHVALYGCLITTNSDYLDCNLYLHECK